MMLKKSVIFSIAFLVVLFCWTINALPSRPTFNSIGQDYIVGGDVVPIEEFPYQVSLETEDGRFYGGGSIISEKHVLTAAHFTEDLYNGFVRAGSNVEGSGGFLYNISNILRHEQYDGKEVSNNIAILTVEPNFVFDTKQQPIKLYNNTEDVPVGQMGTISGYGTHDPRRNRGQPLMAVRVPMVSREFCKTVYEHQLNTPPILESCICAGTSSGGKAPCRGDDGGPLVVDRQLVGIYFYSRGCARPNIPGVYTRVAYFYDWIVKNTAQ